MNPDDVELIYELSPMQQAMLFHSLYAPGSGVYVLQQSLRLTGDLDVAAFERAWRLVVARHDALRTAFYWEDLEKPLQVVHRAVDLPIVRESWRALSDDEQRARLERYLDAERERGFDLAAAPLMRLALFELDTGLHQFVWSLHHVLLDGWSRGQLLQELFACYQAFAAGREPVLAPPRPYREYIAWLDRSDLHEAEDYWRRTLAGFSSPTPVAGGDGRPAPQVEHRDARRRELRLPAAATAELRAMARRHRLTLNTLVQGAWALLLARATGARDVVFGATVSGRPADLPGVESIVGLFINTLPARVEVDPDSRLVPWLADLQQRQAELRRYEYTPLVRVQQWSELPAGVALFDHLLVFENMPLEGGLSLPGLTISETAASDLTNYPFNLIAFPGDELSLEALYDGGRFEVAAVARLLERLGGLLAAFATGARALANIPDVHLRELPALLPGERQQALVEWSDTASACPLEAGVDRLFAARAAATPEAPAVVDGSEVWSYARLDEASSRLAGHLRSLGVGRGSGVGVAMERSVDFVVSLLAVLKAGGAYVPLDPGYPDERLAFMLADVAAPVVLVHGRTRDRLAGLAAEVAAADLADAPAGAAAAADGPGKGDAAGRPRSWRLVCLDADREAIAGHAAAAPPREAASGELAYVVYTSGSTGRPKGVAVPHRAIVRLVLATDYAQLGREDRVAHVSNVSFDAATWEVWGPLLNGGSLVVISKDVALSPARFAARLQEERVTALFLTTALFNQVVREEPAAFGALRHLLFGGEAVDPEVVATALAHGAPERLLHVYGPTESTTFATWHRVRQVAAGAATVPIGLPLANTTAYVASSWGNLAALGEAGELWIGGDGLAWGYFERPELTAERFVPNPWGGASHHMRLYRTGDLVRRRWDGAVEFLGRIDHQAKIRGFRIEPGEVEAAIVRHPQVRDCAVLVRRGAPGEVRLVAYVVAEEGGGLREPGLREHLKRSLPEYMLPAAFVLLPVLPLTANGKLDRAALPAPEDVAGGEEEDYIAPRSPVEEIVAGIWAEVLGRERVGVADDFFALGGHSLLATQVISRVRGTFQVEVPLHCMFETPTVADLARAVEEAQRAGAGLAAPPVEPVPRGRDLALSFAQQRLWFIDQLEPGNAAYNVPWAVELTGPIDVAALHRAFDMVVERHEVLRTIFVAALHGPRQVIAERLPLPLPVVSLEELPRGLGQVETRRLARAEALRSFSLADGPLLRLALLRRAASRHVLLLTVHHIVADGWSVGVLLREVLALYAGLLRGQAAALPELPIQYADFAAWQRSWLSGEVLESQLAYWRRELAGAPQVLALPTDRPRPATPSYRGGVLNLALPPEIARGLTALGRREEGTLFMVLLAAYGSLLGRWSNQEDLLLGTPIANRNRREIEGLIGFFVNTLVLRVDLGGRPSFREVIARVRQAALGAYAHQDLPFERLVEDLAADRDPRLTPLYQAMFGLQNAPLGVRKLAGLSLALLPPDAGAAKFDLTLNCEETTAGLVGYLEYATDLFDTATVRRLAGRLEALLAGVLADPDATVGELPVLLPSERQQALAEWNDTASEYPREATVQGIFAAVAAARPDEPAVKEEAEGEAWTYRRLDEESSRLARHLGSLGVEPGSRVGVSLERSGGLVVALLAILKAGGVYVPLDPAYPDERLALMVEDTGAAVAVVDTGTRERLADLPAVSRSEAAPPLRLVCLDGHRAAIAGESAEAPPDRVTSGDLAYVIYTSGSTGRPKGVAVPHRAILRLVLGTDYVQLGPGDRVAHLSNISFDAATFEVWGALLNGGALVVISKQVALSPADLSWRIREEGVTALFLTTALFNQVMREEPAAFSPVRHVLFGGEACDPGLIAQALERGAPERLLHVYGPTESTTYAAWHRVGEVAATAATVPFGLPLASTTAHVVDRWGELAALGQVGELWIGGEGLAQGYLGRPELTAERFAPDPFAKILGARQADSGGAPGARRTDLGGAPGARLYRTGDLVRRRWDGALEFVGRVDRQVKIRGFRIEPGEVEAALLIQPGVKECAVLVRRDEPGDARLVAYVAAVEGEVLREPALRQLMKQLLPEYMLPSDYVFLPALPLTPNGKVDRAALPAPERGAAEEGYVAPRDPFEEIVAAIWEEVLGRERVGVEDDFFVLGGHSLLATQVMSRVREVFQAEVPLMDLFESPTVSGLARAVQQVSQGGSRAEAPPIVAVERDGELPLSFAQQRLWFIDQLEPGNPSYNVPWAAELTGELKVELLRWTFGEVVRRHEALRTSFAASPAGPVQVVAAPHELALPVISLEGLPEERKQAETRRLAAEEALHAFDLARGPLLRTMLLRLARTRHVLLFTLHHIVGDGWSLGVLVREVTALYAAVRGGLRGGQPSPLPELPVQYADFAVWQRRWLEGEVLERQLAFWRGELAGAPQLLDLPGDRTRLAEPTYRGRARGVNLPGSLSRELAAFSRNEGVTLFMTLLSAFGALLGRWAEQEDLLLGTPIANRTHREIEPLIGFFVNTLVLRVDLAGGPSFRELLARTRGRALGAFAHQDLPLERLVEELVPDRTLRHPPLFQVMFALQNAPVGALELGGLKLRPLTLEASVSNFDLVLSLEEAAAGLTGVLEYSTDLFDPATMERMLSRFERLLAAALERPEAGLWELPWLLDGERQQVLAEWIDSAAPRSARSAHELFAVQAAARPGAFAVEAGGEKLTYGELGARVNRLARHLRLLGVGPEVPVGLMLERSPDLVVGLLAILTAGGAYVPMDPEYPRRRLELIREDSGMRVLVTRAGLARELAAPGLAIVDVEGQRGEIERQDAGELSPLATPGNLAYVVYTSGSTGVPKGVLVEHRSLVNYAEDCIRFYGLSARDRCLQFASINFDASAEEVFGCLGAGATLVLRDEAMLDSPRRFLEAVRDRELTVLALPTAFWHELASALGGSEMPWPACVRLVSIGGERASAEHLARWQSRGLTDVELINVYGPTETTVACLRGGMNRPIDREVPIGLPVANARVYLAGGHAGGGWGDLAALDRVGELWAGGAGLARGYLNRPDLTAERFVPDPFGAPGARQSDSGAAPGARLYRTGDLGRRRLDGRLEFVGRLDQQVKIRGFRIEPGEVEAVLAGQPGVAECAVVARPRGQEVRLVAYVVPVAGARLDEETLRRLLRQSLPEYMLPSACVFLDALPLTGSDKVDRAALPEPEQPGAGEGYVAPRGPFEEILAGIWEEVLERERVGSEDDFFALGGHSLLATQVTSRVRERLGVDLPLRLLFEHPRLAALAARLEALGRAGASETPPLERAERATAPLSFAQERMWFLDRLEPGSIAFNMPLAVRLAGRLDAAALERTLAEIVRRHQPLRTTFAMSGGQPVQVIAPPAPLPLPRVDLSELRGGRGEEEAERLVHEDARRPFDLARGPLFRPLLLRLGGEAHLLLASMHHVASDGWSMGVFAREVAAFYAAFAAGRPSPLPEPAVQYADYAAWQRRWLAGPALAEQLAYWRGQLAGAPPLLELPTERPRPPVQTSRGEIHRLLLSPELSARVRGLATRSSATLYMVALSAWQALFHRMTGQADVVVGSPIAGRTRREIEGLIGFFLNTLALRTDLGGEPSFREVLGRVREVTLAAYSHQDVPFERLLEELRPERDLSHTPVFQVMVNGLEFDRAGAGRLLELPGLTLEMMGATEPVARFDLEVYTREMDGRIALDMLYNADLFVSAQMEQMASHFEALLAAGVNDPGRRPGDVLLAPFAPAARRGEVLPVLADAAFPAAALAGSLADRFRAVAAAAPDRVALRSGDEVWTYGALQAAAGRVAHALLASGAGGDRVALLFRPGGAMAAAILGALAAGAPYVPLDPSYPRERLRAVLEDAGASALLAGGRQLAAAARELAADLPGGGPAILDLAALPPAAAGWAPPPVPPEVLAYFLYTSGSTGVPKGVMQTQGNVLGHVRNYVRRLGLAPGDRLTLLPSYSFDAAVMDLFGALLSGAELDAWDVRERGTAGIPAWLAEREVTVYHSTPTLLRSVIGEGGAAARAGGPRTRFRGATPFPALRLAVLGGEEVRRDDVERFRRAFPGCRLINGLGPTESTLALQFAVAPGDPLPGRAGLPVGLPVEEMRAVLHNGAGVQAAVWGTGEILLGSPFLAPGYWRRPELTAAAFVPSHTSGAPGARLYRTGDLGRLLPDGTIEFVGRRDLQVKVRGVRIEPAEVEAALLALPGVREAAVLALGEGEARRLAACVVPAAAASVEDLPRTLRAALAARLPAAMVPSEVFTLDALPLTPTGKVDRRALAALAPASGPAAAAAFEPPQGWIEETLATTWGELLGRERIGRQDDFFALGGHSLLATQLATRVLDEFGVELSLRRLFEKPTLAALAAEIESALIAELLAEEGPESAELEPSREEYRVQSK